MPTSKKTKTSNRNKKRQSSSEAINANKNSKPGWLTIISLPIIGSLITLGIQQGFFSKNKRIERQLEVKEALVKENYPIYNKLLRLVEIGHNVDRTNFNFNVKTFTPTSQKQYAGTKTITYDIPTIAVVYDNNKVNKILEEWLEIVEKIEERKDFIDHEVYRAFRDVVNFQKKYPPIGLTNLDEVKNSKWAKDKVKGQWFAENYFLKQKVQDIMLLK